MSACGIDFGTSNSTLTLARGGRVQPVAIDPESRIARTTPTVLYFPDDEDAPPFFGSAAMRAYVEDGMAGRYIQSIKRHLPSPSFEGTMVGETFRTIEELVAGFLAHVRAAASRAADRDVTDVVLGRPARFHADDDRDALAQGRLLKAAFMAGFARVGFQLEPIAAARAFEADLDRDVLCLVGDLGGGTSDFTVIRLGPDRIGSDRSKDVLGSGGVATAGNDLDSELVSAFVLGELGVKSTYRPHGKDVPIPTALHRGVTERHTMQFVATRDNLAFLDTMIRTGSDRAGLLRLKALLEANASFPFFDAVGATKEALSAAQHVDLRFAIDALSLSAPVERGAFEVAIADPVARIEAELDGLLRRLELRADDVDVVFLTGGTSQVPRVRALFDTRFPGRIAARDVFTSVGAGLGIEAWERFGA